MNDFTHLPYRPCVGVMLVSTAGLAFVGSAIFLTPVLAILRRVRRYDTQAAAPAGETP